MMHFFAGPKKPKIVENPQLFLYQQVRNKNDFQKNWREI